MSERLTFEPVMPKGYEVFKGIKLVREKGVLKTKGILEYGTENDRTIKRFTIPDFNTLMGYPETPEEPNEALVDKNKDPVDTRLAAMDEELQNNKAEIEGLRAAIDSQKQEIRELSESIKRLTDQLQIEEVVTPAEAEEIQASATNQHSEADATSPEEATPQSTETVDSTPKEYEWEPNKPASVLIDNKYGQILQKDWVVDKIDDETGKITLKNASGRHFLIIDKDQANEMQAEIDKLEGVDAVAEPIAPEPDPELETPQPQPGEAVEWEDIEEYTPPTETSRMARLRTRIGNFVTGRSAAANTQAYLATRGNRRVVITEVEESDYEDTDSRTGGRAMIGVAALLGAGVLVGALIDPIEDYFEKKHGVPKSGIGKAIRDQSSNNHTVVIEHGKAVTENIRDYSGPGWSYTPPHDIAAGHLEFFNDGNGNHAFALDLPSGYKMPGQPGDYSIVGPKGNHLVDHIGWKGNGPLSAVDKQKILAKFPNATFKLGRLFFNDQDGGPGPSGWVKHSVTAIRF